MIYRISDYEQETETYVNLTEGQIKVIRWLEDRGFIRNTVSVQKTEIPTIESI